MAAEADEPAEMNFVRKHAMEQAKEFGLSVRDAATRVFSNSAGSYSANVGLAIENGGWEGEEQLQQQFVSRKGYAFNADKPGMMEQQVCATCTHEGRKSVMARLDGRITGTPCLFQTVFSFLCVLEAAPEKITGLSLSSPSSGSFPRLLIIASSCVRLPRNLWIMTGRWTNSRWLSRRWM